LAGPRHGFVLFRGAAWRAARRGWASSLRHLRHRCFHFRQMDFRIGIPGHLGHLADKGKNINQAEAARSTRRRDALRYPVQGDQRGWLF
jgi:hypothetical protein